MLNKSRPKWSKTVSITWSIGILAVGILLVVAFFYLDKNNQISNAIHSWGILGVFLSVFLMALFCVIPVPSEFLMIMNMKIFGVWLGIFYTWVGAMMGAVAVFFMARSIGSRILQAFITENRLQQVNRWIKNRGAMGLLIVRLIPLPFIVVNYSAGVMESVSPWEYIWTTAIGLLPYDLGAALVFLGLSTKYIWWLAIGGFAVIAIWVAGYIFNRTANKLNRWAH
jgi:uncharacterized membrane protein YdjX (TVP38/TMEM64 family)